MEYIRLQLMMAVLYRPILERKNDIYTIEAYDGNITIRTEEMKKMSAEQVQSALVFFWGFANALSVILQSVSMEQITQMRTNLQTEILRKDGVGSE